MLSSRREIQRRCVAWSNRVATISSSVLSSRHLSPNLGDHLYRYTPSASPLFSTSSPSSHWNRFMATVASSPSPSSHSEKNYDAFAAETDSKKERLQRTVNSISHLLNRRDVFGAAYGVIRSTLPLPDTTYISVCSALGRLESGEGISEYELIVRKMVKLVGERAPSDRAIQYCANGLISRLARRNSSEELEHW